MKKILFFISFIIFSISIQAQDLIVTNEGDSLNCKITNIRPDFVYFTFKYKGEIRNTIMPLKQMKFHKVNYYPDTVVYTKKVSIKDNYPHFRAALNGGWSFRTAEIDNSIPGIYKQYLEDLNKGHHYGIDVSYYFSKQLGLGLKYNEFRAKNELQNVVAVLPNGTTQNSKLIDDISIKFVGPFISTRLMNSKKTNSLLCNLGVGYMGYKDKAFLISDVLIKGNTVGLCWDIGYDVGITKNLALGIQLSYIMGTLREFDFYSGSNKENVDLDEDSYERLSHFDISLGLRFVK